MSRETVRNGIGAAYMDQLTWLTSGSTSRRWAMGDGPGLGSAAGTDRLDHL